MGYLVLGLGILAVVTVLMLAFGGDSVDTNEPAPDAAVSANLQSGLSENMKGAQAPQQTAPAPLALARQKKVDIGDLDGGWKASIGPYVGVLQMEKGLFEVILARPEPELARLYSSGTYTIMDDIVVLKPRLDWKPPTAQPGFRYERLTTGSYPMIVGFKNGAMVWQNVPQTEKRIYVPTRSPLLLDKTREYIVWKRAD